MTKLQFGIAAAVIVAGAAGLIVQQRTISGLREDVVAARRKAARLAGENVTLVQSRAETEAELTQRRATIARSPKPAESPPRSTELRAAMPADARAIDLKRPLPDTPEIQQEKARIHRRYDPFLQRRGLTTAQSDRIIELWIHQNDARHDLQAAVESAGARGDAPGIEELRHNLYAPITEELREILGHDGYAEYVKYEQRSYYKVGWVDPLQREFSVANLTLSPIQIDQLVPVFARSDHPRSAKVTDIGSQSQIDWGTVVAESRVILTPAQQVLLETFVNQQKTRPR